MQEGSRDSTWAQLRASVRPFHTTVWKPSHIYMMYVHIYNRKSKETLERWRDRGEEETKQEEEEERLLNERSAAHGIIAWSENMRWEGIGTHNARA